MYRRWIVKLTSRARFSTICLHAGQEPDPATGAIITPIYQTSTYVQDELGKHKGFEYGRTQNPTRLALENNLAAIEGGQAAFAFASGMAAIGAIATMLQPGDHVVVSENVYGGTFRLFDTVLSRSGISFDYVDTSNMDVVERAVTPATRMMFVETPTNPILALTDLSAASDLASRRGLRLVVDNTFASPYVQRPIELGADIVTHSTTKYLNGHSDSIGGIVIVTRDEDVEWLRFVQNAAGAILGPFDSWLVLRGTKTLPLRMQRHNTNGLAIARVPGRAPEGAPRALSRPPVTPAARAGHTPDAGVWRDGLVRARVARGGPAAAQLGPADGARREPRRRGNAHLSPRDDDACLGAGRATRGPRHHRRPRTGSRPASRTSTT